MSKELKAKSEDNLIRYTCQTCGNGCLVDLPPDNSVCGGCDNPQWVKNEYQEPYKTEEDK